MYLARALGAELLGVYALGMTIIGFVGIFNGLGLPQAAVRFVALYKASGKMEQLRGFLLSGTGIILVANLVLGFVVLLVGSMARCTFLSHAIAFALFEAICGDHDSGRIHDILRKGAAGLPRCRSAGVDYRLRRLHR